MRPGRARHFAAAVAWGATLFLTTACQNNIVPPNKLPTADVEWSTQGVYAPLDISFDASNSRDPDGEITRYEWTFGDGKTAEGQTVSHTFTTSGSYIVVLRVTDDRGGWDGASTGIEVLPPPPPTIVPPVARFTVSPANPKVGQVITFSGAGSYDPAGISTKTITSYAWEFGDGGTASGQTVMHTYAAAGRYRAVLRVTDNDAAQGVEQRSIQVDYDIPPPPPPPG